MINEKPIKLSIVESDSGGIGRLMVRRLHLTWKTIENAYNLTLRPVVGSYSSIEDCDESVIKINAPSDIYIYQTR